MDARWPNRRKTLNNGIDSSSQRQKIGYNEPNAKAILPEPRSVQKANSYQLNRAAFRKQIPISNSYQFPISSTKVIRTEAGTLKLVPASADQLRGIARYWRMELLGYGDGPPDFGLVFQHGNKEVYGVKIQCLEMPEADAMAFHRRSRNMIAAALPRYLLKNHAGVMVPCAYFKNKSPGMFEVGLAFFVGPAPEDATMQGSNDKTHWDEKLGAGATRMILDMLDSLGEPNPAPGREAPAATKVVHVIGMDLRPRLAIGFIVMPFVVQGQTIVVVKHPMTDDEPLWTEVVRAGFRKLPYASMVPAGFAGEPPADLEHH